MRWHFSASLLLHAILLLLVVFLQPSAPPKLPQEASVNVELVALPRPKLAPATTEKAQAALPEKARQPLLTAEKIIAAARKQPPQQIVAAKNTQAQAIPDALIPARQLYSATLLADHHNRSAREAMKLLAVDERIIQLCDIEAVEQVKRARAELKPDYVIAYAMSDLKLSAHEVDADGGAFLSRSNWYGLKFRCDVSPDNSKVISFAYLVGDPIPKSQWASHNLTADATSAD